MLGLRVANSFCYIELHGGVTYSIQGRDQLAMVFTHVYEVPAMIVFLNKMDVFKSKVLKVILSHPCFSPAVDSTLPSSSSFRRFRSDEIYRRPDFNKAVK